MEGLAEAVGTVIASVLGRGIIAAGIANKVAFKSIAVEAITKERIAWLDELRAIAVDLTTKLSAINRANMPATEDAMQAADRVLAQLQLHLNPDGEKERKFWNWIWSLKKFPRSLVNIGQRKKSSCCQFANF